MTYGLTKDNRYQYQPWHIRFLRDRYLLLVPFEAAMLWVVDRWTYTERQYTTIPFTLKQAWSVAVGLSQARRNYVWTWAEVKAMRKGKETACAKEETLLDI